MAQRPRAPAGRNPWYPWHGNDPVLNKIRQKDLYNEGFIVYPGGRLPPIDDEFRIPTVNIHSVFQWGNWPDLSFDDYHLLVPALNLASKFLTQPAFFDWWRALNVRPVPVLDDPNLIVRTGRFIGHIAPPRGHITDPQERPAVEDTWRTIQSISGCVLWRFGGNRSDSIASTLRVRQGGKPGTNGTCGSQVSIHQEYLDILRGTVKATEFVKACSQTDDEAKIKTWFCLAVTLAHEFCHVFMNATIERQEEEEIFNYHEPFYHNFRVNELGCTFESVMFGGLIRPLGYNSTTWHALDGTRYTNMSLSAPYGLASSPWPGVRGTYPDTGYVHRPTLLYPGWNERNTHAIDMVYITKFFTTRFWTQEIGQYGILAMDPQIWLGVAQYIPPIEYAQPDEEFEQVEHGPPIAPMPTPQTFIDKGFRLKTDPWDDSEDSDPEGDHPMRNDFRPPPNLEYWPRPQDNATTLDIVRENMPALVALSNIYAGD